jgi:hypothetical protein
VIVLMMSASAPAWSQDSTVGAQTRSSDGSYVDFYGQIIGYSWPGKVARDSDLQQGAVNEADRLKILALPPGEYDRHGGWLGAGWSVTSTGYFTVAKHDNVWWLITPDGHPCFYRGLDTAPALTWETTPVTGREHLFTDLPPQQGEFAGAWGGDAWGGDPSISSFAFCTANLIRKYGPDWRAAFLERTHERLKAWGFSGYGKWSDFSGDTPSIPVLNRNGVVNVLGGDHPDPFDPATQAELKAVLSSQMEPHVTDPNVVAWSFGNEYTEIVTPDEIRGILADTGIVPAKRALVDFALKTFYGCNCSKLSDDEIERLRQYFVDHYYDLIEKTVKSIDPHHLYAGSWLVESNWVNNSDWYLSASHCDIVGFDHYGFELAEPGMQSLIQHAGKPVLCGEFTFPQSEPQRGFSDFGNLSLTSESASGRAYEAYMASAAGNPYCVGLCWFQYRDQPVTGRGPGSGPELVYGENYPFGLIDVTDQPKWILINHVRSANLSASARHAKAAQSSPAAR